MLLQRGQLCAMVVVLGSLACSEPSPVRWTATRSVTLPAERVAVTPTGEVVRDTLAILASQVVVPDDVCRGSLRLSSSGGKLFGVWWRPRADSTALLVSSVSGDRGVTWRNPARVDTTDHGRIGCARGAPAIAADAASGYVHVSYPMFAAEGPGLFYAHSMDGGLTFHSPVPILYGERLAATSVAAWGNVVAVGFEDPGSRAPRIGLALSATMGHIFEDRLLPVSDDNAAATQPLVAVSGHHFTIAWRERPAMNGAVVLRVRAGTLP
jgi:hypothetical protein